MSPAYKFFAEASDAEKTEAYSKAAKCALEAQNAILDPFLDDTPAISSKLTIHNASSEISCAACSA